MSCGVSWNRADIASNRAVTRKWCCTHLLEWDTACFAKLRGMFGLAVWSQSRRRLVLARDPKVGIKPLYVCHQDGAIAFGSELKVLFAHPEIDRAIDLDGLNCYLSLNYVPAPYTLVKGIEKLLPGHFLEWRGGESHTEAYWKLEMRPRERTVEEAAEELDPDCCRRRYAST